MYHNQFLHRPACLTERKHMDGLYMCEYSPWQNNVNDAEYLKRALATFTFIHICYFLYLFFIKRR